MKLIVLIVAGGSGSRMKSDLPKQFIELNGEPILMHTIRRFYRYNSKAEIRVVLPEAQIPFWEELVDKHKFDITHTIYEGGETRFHSVLNGLKNIGEGCIVAIHDGVRPLVSAKTIQHCIDKVAENFAVIPVVDVVETVRRVEGNKSRTVPRDAYKLVQTPQVFQSNVLLKAYAQQYNKHFTDHASVVEALGHEVSLVQGNRENIKITTPEDLLIAEALINRP